MARYKLMGNEIEGADQNAEPVSMEGQRTDPLHATTVVYETDDLEEAKAIVQAGGFYRDRDNFVAASLILDSHTEETPRDQPDTPFFRPSTFPQKGE
jgi:hypothetical protein